MAHWTWSLGRNLTTSECVRTIAQIWSGLFSHGRVYVAENFVTSTAKGPVIPQPLVSFYMALAYDMFRMKWEDDSQPGRCTETTGNVLKVWCVIVENPCTMPC